MYIYIYIKYICISISVYIINLHSGILQRRMLHRRPTRRMLHDVIISVPFECHFLICFHKTHKRSLNEHLFPYFSPPKGTLTLTPGMGMGGDNLGPKIKPKSQKHSLYGNCSHFCDISQTMLKNIFEICSYIQKMIANPINALKITICNTKNTNNDKIHLKIQKIEK